MVAQMQKAFFVALNALALFSCASMSRADEVLKMKPGIAVMVRVPGAENGNMKAIVGNPDIADVTFGPNNAFWFVGKKPGTTNIIVLNSVTGADAYNATIEVGPEQPPPPPDRKKIITLYILPKNVQDQVITREFYCDPGCTYLSPTLGGDITSASTTTVRHQNAEGVETGRSVYDSSSVAPPSPAMTPPAAPPQ
jgi:Pilus formation protein N terminal region